MAVDEFSDVRIRKVKSLQGRARDLAIEQNLNEEDLVVIKTKIGSLPQFKIEKIEGDPLEFLFKISKE